MVRFALCHHFPPSFIILPFEYTCSCFIIVFYTNQKSDSGRNGPLDLVIKKFPLGARSSGKGVTHLGVPIVVASERASENTLLRCAGPAIRDVSTACNFLYLYVFCRKTGPISFCQLFTDLSKNIFVSTSEEFSRSYRRLVRML